MKLFLNTKIILSLSAIFVLQLNNEKFTLLNGCNTQPGSNEQNTSLKKAFKDDFLIGTALNTAQIEEKDPQAATLVPQQFSAVTPENIMKSEVIHPGWDRYNFDLADKIVAYGKKYNIKVNGHTLIWHSQLPAYMRNMKDADSVKQFFVNHINTVAGRYDGKVFSWDVVNEALSNSSGSGGDYFYCADYLGRNYIADAFRWANAADPTAKLFINDYNLESDSRKLDSVIKIINELKAAAVPIHGVGSQMHISINTSNSGIDNAFQKLAATGLLVNVSEMDVRINPSSANPFTATTALFDAQAQKYRYVAESYFRNVPAAQRWVLTVWNLADADSWIVAEGKIDFPTLFDAGYNKKTAFTQYSLGLQ